MRGAGLLPSFLIPAAVLDDRSIRHWVGWMLLLGIGWRILRWGLGMPLWGDEVMLALNFLDRSWSGWLQPLEMGQVAPPLFMLLHGWLMQSAGHSEWILRFPSLIFGIGALLLFARFALLVVEQRAALSAVAVLAVTYYTVRHGSEFKPYALDLLVAVSLLLAACRFRSNPVGLWQCGMLVSVILVAPFCSFPSVFVTAAVVSGLVIDAAMKRDRRRLQVTGIISVLAVVLFTVQYTVIVVPQAEANALLNTLWRDAFPPGGFVAFLGWLLEQSSGRLMAYPLGGQHYGSVLTLLLVCAGTVCLFRNRQWFLLWIALMPFVCNVAAAAAHLYPYGQSERIAQHLAPSICLLAGVGLVGALALFNSRRPDRVLSWILFGLSVLGFAGMAEVVARPYKSPGDLFVRDMIQTRLPELNCRAVQVINPKQTVPVNFRWYLAINPANRFAVDPGDHLQPAKAPICLLHFDADRDPEAAERLEQALAFASKELQLIQDQTSTAYIYGGTDHPHRVRSIILSNR